MFSKINDAVIVNTIRDVFQRRIYIQRPANWDTLPTCASRSTLVGCRRTISNMLGESDQAESVDDCCFKEGSKFTTSTTTNNWRDAIDNKTTMKYYGTLPISGKLPKKTNIANFIDQTNNVTF